MSNVNLKNKVCLITGATNGIGKVTAKELARLGARVFILARNKEKGNSTVQEIIAETKNKNVELLIADLSSQKQIKKAANLFLKKNIKLHILINNAGIMFPDRNVTEDNIEATFAVNHLAPFLLTNLLLDRMKKSGPARVVTVASIAHSYGKIHFHDIGLEKKYSQIRAYGQSKLANILFTSELAARCKNDGVSANCMHPGTVNTGLFKNDRGIAKYAMKAIKPFMRTPEKGAETLIYLATSPEVSQISGEYFHNCKIKKAKLHNKSDEHATQLWQISENLTGINSKKK